MTCVRTGPRLRSGSRCWENSPWRGRGAAETAATRQGQESRKALRSGCARRVDPENMERQETTLHNRSEVGRGAGRAFLRVKFFITPTTSNRPLLLAPLATEWFVATLNQNERFGLQGRAILRWMNGSISIRVCTIESHRCSVLSSMCRVLIARCEDSPK